MHLTIFSKSARFYTVRRLAESARMRGHKVRVIDPLQCELVLGDGGTRLFHKGKCPLVSEIGFYGSHRLVVVVTDGLELMVEIREAYVIIHCRLVEFYHLYFTLED